MPYTADPTNLTTPADGDLIANCPAEVRGVKTLLANTIATKQTIIADATISANTALTAADSGKTFILDGGVVTLPNPVRFTKLKFINASGGSGTIKTNGSGSGLIYFPDGSSIPSTVNLGLGTADTLELYADSSNWFITNMTGDIVIRLSNIANRPARVDQLYGKGMSNTNYTSSGRALGSVYTNGSVSPRFVSVTVDDLSGGSSGNITLQVDTGSGYAVIDKVTDTGGVGSNAKVSGYVPAGANYKVVVAGSTSGVPNLTNWNEYGL